MKRIEIKKQIIEIIIMFALSFGVMCVEGLFSAEGRADILRIVCDGMFVSGAVFIGLSLLRWIGSDGQFDSLAFITKTILSLKWSVFGDFKEKYIAYKEGKERSGLPLEMMITGAVGVVIAAVMLFFC